MYPNEFKPNYTVKNLEAYLYFAFNLTYKYTLGTSSSAIVSKTSSSSSVSSSSPTFLYLSFKYYSSINFIGSQTRDNNNYDAAEWLFNGFELFGKNVANSAGIE